MVSEVVATRSRGSEKTVNLIGRGKLNSNSSLSRLDSAKSLSLGNR